MAIAKDNNWNSRSNMSMLTDLYELTMAKGYLDHHVAEQTVIFDLFFRQVPEQGGYAIMAGVEQMIDYLVNLRFTKEDISYLRQTDLFDEGFLAYLSRFKFSCDVWAIPEGTPVFPGEPLVKVRGPMIQAQMIETMLLVTINHQSLIATKTARIVRASQGRPIFEFGARRAQGYDAAVLGARAAYLAGVSGTSCTIAGQQFGIPLVGTMAHSWVQSFPTEYEAFAAYAKSYPDKTLLLVDTYNSLKTGVPNAIRVAKQILEPIGKRLLGIRIDSGDLTYISIEARKMLNHAGLNDCKITASNALDEYLIRDLIVQGAKIDAFGVGERLITSRAEPVFGGVYKMAAIERQGGLIPKMKITDNPEKLTIPCDKEIYRIYDKATHMALADVMTLADETIDPHEPYEIFDPEQTWKRKTLVDFTVQRLLVPIFKAGQCVYTPPSLEASRQFCEKQLQTLWDSIRRFENPQKYYVDLSKPLWDVRQDLLHQHTKMNEGR